MKQCLVILLYFIFLLPGAILFGQTPDEQLAVQYFQQKEYDKAVVYYEKLFDKTGNDFYYGYFLECLIELQEFKKAEKLVRRQQKKSPTNPVYSVDMGYVYNKSGEPQKAKKEHENLLSQLTDNQSHVFEMANAFIRRNELDYALATYEKGRKLLKGQYPFSFEMGEIYFAKGDLNGMVGEYLDVLLINDAYLQQVQNYLIRIYGSEKFGSSESGNELIKGQLLKRIQKHPDKPVFAEMLIWLLVQEKDFNSALIQSKALDKRQKEDGFRLMGLAQTCFSNRDYDTAAKAYKAVIDKGKDNYNYIPAKIELLNVMNQKILDNANYTQEDILALEKNYNSTLAELGTNARTAPLLKGLAHLNAFYLHNTEKAIDLLEEAIMLPGATKTFIAESKLELGDILLMEGDIWEASLYYSQVDKDFRHDPLGDEAKLRNAKVSYYTGDFGWAQAQLDVLKGSTSKLIANDAMSLSLLITDNSTLDTNTVPLEMFAKAELLAFQNKDREALMTLDSINEYFQGHELADDILMKKASIMEKQQNWEAAAKFLVELVKAFGYDILADDALFKLGEIYQYKLNDPEKAKEYYQQLITEHQGSTFAVEARKRFRELRGDKIN